MVAALTSTTSSLLVSLRSGVGIRTFFAIKLDVNQSAFRRRQDSFEFAEAGFDFARLAGVAVDRIESLQAVSGDAEYNGIFGGNLARRDQLARDTERHAARGLGENAFGLREKFNCLANLIVGDVFGRAIGFFHHAQGVKA